MYYTERGQQLYAPFKGQSNRPLSWWSHIVFRPFGTKWPHQGWKDKNSPVQRESKYLLFLMHTVYKTMTQTHQYLLKVDSDFEGKFLKRLPKCNRHIWLVYISALFDRVRQAPTETV